MQEPIYNAFVTYYVPFDFSNKIALCPLKNIFLFTHNYLFAIFALLILKKFLKYTVKRWNSFLAQILNIKYATN